MSIIHNTISKLMDRNIGMDKMIKLIEYTRGLYRYPSRMIGRRIKKDTKNSTDILVIAAHPDDEILGVGTTIYRHIKNGDNVTVVYVTNGSGGDGASWKTKINDTHHISEIRYREGIKALSLIGMFAQDVICLGYPDAGTHRYVDHIAHDVLSLIQKLKPERIYVHCIEGGHSDHDFTSFIVKAVCGKIEFNNVYEWAEYNRSQPLGTKDVKFLDNGSHCSKSINIDITDRERLLKKKMLACHKSQGVVAHFTMGEAIRQANLTNMEVELLKYSLFPKKRLRPIMNQLLKYIERRRSCSIDCSC
ncbi:PIG-L family deacetylase [Lentibacillus sp. N15]|uniref:PIG-L deacetylase family protein n=1 Tax=Lentibacillus songyuanensis TaxID=3136161 RepID=UPI0031BA3B9C